MENDKDSKNSPANAHKMRLSRKNGYTNKHAENQATDLSDQTQPQLVSVQAMPTNASHMESYDTNTNLATHYINSSIQMTQANNPYKIKNSPSKEQRVNNQKKSWTSLFAKLARGASTYSTFSVCNQITTKNNSAAIFDICTLNNISMTDIVVVLNKSIGKDILGLKPHFTKGIRTHLEIIFKSYDNVQKYSTEGISLFNQTFLGYIPLNMWAKFLQLNLLSLRALQF